MRSEAKGNLPHNRKHGNLRHHPQHQEFTGSRSLALSAPVRLTLSFRGSSAATIPLSLLNYAGERGPCHHISDEEDVRATCLYVIDGQLNALQLRC